MVVEVGEAIAVDVAHRHGPTLIILDIVRQSGGAVIERKGLADGERRLKRSLLAEPHGSTVAVHDGQIVDAVAIDVAQGGDRVPETIVTGPPDKVEAVFAVEIGEIDSLW